MHIFIAGVEGTEEVSSSLLLNDQVVGYIALCRIILLLPNLRGQHLFPSAKLTLTD